MKLKWSLQSIVLSTALLSEAAFAQSSVQIYGLIDTFVGDKKALNGQSAGIAGNGGMTASFWGFRGNEDLGGGTSVVFDLESYFNPQTGQYGRTGFPADGLFSRNAYVGLKGNYGTLTLGLAPPLLWFATINFNPFLNSFVFSPIVVQSYEGVNGQGVFGNAGEWSNIVYYSTPSFDGVVGKAMYAFGNDAGHPGQNKWTGQLAYNRGSFAASAVYQQIKFSVNPGDLTTNLPGLTTQSVANLGVSYNFNFVKVYGQYQHIWDSVASGDVGINTGQLGVSIPVGTGAILASDAYSKSEGGSTVYRNTWAIGYDYPLSKRTDIYAAFLSDRASRLSSGDTLGAGIRTTF